MSAGRAELRIAGTRFGAGEEISGEVSWSRSSAPREVAVRLFWFTRGKGDRDSETVLEHVVESPLAEDQRSFFFIAPSAPPSFSGKLISLLWAVELVIDGKGESVSELVIGPNGLEVDLNRPEWISMEVPWAKAKSWLPKFG